MSHLDISIYSLLFYFILAIPIRVLIHELGHGVTAYFFKPTDISIFLGSYGNTKDSFRIDFKKFHFYIIKQPQNWRGGLCKLSSDLLTTNEKILYVLAGPIASILLGICSYLFYKYGDFIPHFFLTLSIFSAFDGVVNLIPSKKFILTSQSNPIKTDGKLILELVKLKLQPKEVLEAIEYSKSENYKEASLLFSKIIPKYTSKIVLNTAIFVESKLENYNLALEYALLLEKKFILDSYDYATLGTAFTLVKKHEDALVYYYEALKMEKNNKVALNNLAYSQYSLGEEEKAEKNYRKVLDLDSNFHYSLTGLAEIYLYKNEFKKAYILLEKSLNIESNYPETLWALGYYYTCMNENNLAVQHLEQAKKLKPSLFYKTA